LLVLGNAGRLLRFYEPLLKLDDSPVSAAP
jgi:hypothetical protein